MDGLKPLALRPTAAVAALLAILLLAPGAFARPGDRRRILQSGGTPSGPHALGSFTSITIPLEICGHSPTVTNQQLQDQVLGSGRSLKSYFDACSFGQLTMAATDSQNLVLSEPVPVNGSGVCKGNSVNCDINAVGDEALAYVRDVLKIDLSQYSIQNLIFPSGMPGCGFAGGMGSWGCFTNDVGPDTPNLKCRTWMVGSWAQGLIHEVGHTLGLSHADVNHRDDSSDASCVMSNMGQFVCPNAYHSQLLGWTQALETVDIGSDMSQGQWLTFQLPTRVSTKTNFIQLTGAGDDLFVSYSAPVKWEEGETDAAYKLLVHKQSSAQDWSRSQRVAMLGAGQRWEQSSGGASWVVHLGTNPSDAQATVHLCRADGNGDCPAGSEPTGTGSSQAALKKKKKKGKSGRKLSQ